MDNNNYQTRYFLSYSGIKLPLKLVSPLEDNEIGNRNTFYKAYFDDQELLAKCEKVVYGDVEMEHHYSYYDNGVLKQARILEEGEDERLINFDESGTPMM